MDGTLIPGFWSTVVPSDTTDLTGAMCLYVGTGGNVVVQDASNKQVTFKNLQNGQLLPGRFRKVMAASTAADILAGYPVTAQ